MNEQDPSSLYALLGVAPGSSQFEVRQSYLAKARLVHPDICRSSEAEEAMRSLNAAYAVLGDAGQRRRYDMDHGFVSPSAAHSGTRTMNTETSNRETSSEIMIAAPAVPQTFHQLGIAVTDGSGSMHGEALNGMTKADAVNVALREMFTRFKISAQRKNFSFGVVPFDSAARVQLAPTPAADIDENDNYDPCAGTGSDTFIGAGLRKATDMATAFLASAGREVPTSVVIVVMSDGRDREASGLGPGETLGIAAAIKSNPAITICSCYFAQKGLRDPEAEETLRKIASNPVTGYKTVYDAETLRAFFIASMSAGRKI